MKTVSTKLDNSLHNRFIEVCNDEGKCQSEFLRDLIQSVCEDLETEEVIHLDLDKEQVITEPSEPTPELMNLTVRD